MKNFLPFWHQARKLQIDTQNRSITYYLLPLPLHTRIAWSIIAVEAESDTILESALAYDLSSNQKDAEHCFSMLVDGVVCPSVLIETITELMSIA